DEARAALDVIRRHGFNRVGNVGHASPSMVVFLANADAPAPLAFERPDTPAPPHVPAARQTGETKQETKTTAVGTSGPGGMANPVKPPGVNVISPDALPSGRQLAMAGTPGGDTGPNADRVPFEWRQLQVRREGRDW